MRPSHPRPPDAHPGHAGPLAHVGRAPRRSDPGCRELRAVPPARPAPRPREGLRLPRPRVRPVQHGPRARRRDSEARSVDLRRRSLRAPGRAARGELWVRLRLGTRAKRVSITTRDPRPAPTTEAVLDGDGRRSYPRAGPPETAQEPKKHARGLQDLIRATQLTVLAAQPLELLALQRGQLLGALAGIGLCLAHPRAQRLRTDTETWRPARSDAQTQAPSSQHGP